MSFNDLVSDMNGMIVSTFNEDGGVLYTDTLSNVRNLEGIFEEQGEVARLSGDIQVITTVPIVTLPKTSIDTVTGLEVTIDPKEDELITVAGRNWIIRDAIPVTDKLFEVRLKKA